MLPESQAAHARLRERLAADASMRAARVEIPDGAIVLQRWRAVLIAVALIAATSAVWLATLPARTPVASSALVPEVRTPVQFVIVARDAHTVHLVGDFNDWNPGATPLVSSPSGVWSVVLPLDRGRFTYSYLIDGADWRRDPDAPMGTDDFGRPSSIVFVPGLEE
jgi:hypothetical protein